MELSIIILANKGSLMPGSLVEKIAGLFMEGSADKAEEKTTLSAIQVPKEILGERAGLYFSDKTAVARKLEIKEDRLQIRLGNGLPLEGISGRAMQISGRPYAVYEFGETGLTETIGNGEPVHYGKCEAFSPERDDLVKYEGSFRCDEIEETFHIKLEDSALSLAGEGIKTRKLETLGIHSFIADITADLNSLINLNIKFHEENRRITGFRLNTRDIRNLFFEKVEE